MTSPSDIKMIMFDTFGTVVDWRESIVSDLTEWGERNGLQLRWDDIADRWRGKYGPQKERVRSGEIEWRNLDALHAEALEWVLEEVGAPSLTDEQFQHINRVWHRLHAWPDSVEGLQRLKSRYVIAPLSNGSMSLLTDMAKEAGLPWDVILSCELFSHYKPDPRTYLGACSLMGLQPEQVLMCAAHNYDLAAARALGLATAFVERPTEYGPGQTTDLSPDQDWDFIVSDLGSLATELHC